MKLLLILCIEEHEKEVRKLLRKEKVPMYSEVDVQGYLNENSDADVSNWFAHDEVKRFSKLFFCIQTDEKVSAVILAVKNYNESHEGMKNYPLHAYKLNVEETV